MECVLLARRRQVLCTLHERLVFFAGSLRGAALGARTFFSFLFSVICFGEG